MHEFLEILTGWVVVGASTSNTNADTSPQLPAVLPLTPPFLVTFDTAAGTSPQLPAVLPPTPPFLVTSNTAAGTSPQLPASLSLDTCPLSS
ncbi:unnamed protein product [Prunus armeniaca]